MTVLGAITSTVEYPSYVYKSSDQTGIVSTSMADISGMGLSIAAGASYMFWYYLVTDADVTGTSVNCAVNGPASPTLLVYRHIYYTTIGHATLNSVAYDVNTGASTSLGTTKALYELSGILVNGANAGTLIPRVRIQSTGTGNVRAGSCGVIIRVA